MMCDGNCCKRCRRRIASAYLLRLRGYEEAAMILKNRYEYALYVHNPEADYLLSEFREMEREENMVRRELFRSLSAMDNDYSREVLWQLYIERKQPDEAAKLLGISERMVRKLQMKGLRSLEVPIEFINAVIRRWKDNR